MYICVMYIIYIYTYTQYKVYIEILTDYLLLV